jgi:hypothetical protein
VRWYKVIRDSRRTDQQTRKCFARGACTYTHIAKRAEVAWEKEANESFYQVLEKTKIKNT